MSPRLLALSLLLLAALPRPARALVEGDRHVLYRTHRLFGGAVSTGNTLMTASIAAPQVNSGLLPRSPGDVRGIPLDARLAGAYLFWSGSIDGRVDRTADLTAADGTVFRDVDAERCGSVPAQGGFFYCRADVTALLADHPGGRAWNGTYQVGAVQALPGILRPDGTCVEEACQGKYAAWSLVLVYSSPSAPSARDVFLYDGFRHLDEDRAPGVDRFQIAGFEFPAAGSAELSYFALEGDTFLGVPPQDTDPVFPCADCFDYLRFGGTKLQDANNPPNNLFNSSSPGGFTLGLDQDRFDVSRFLRAGQQSVEIEVGSGDGVVPPGPVGEAGAGESFFLGYVLLSVQRNAPRLASEAVLAVVPDRAAAGEPVTLTLRVRNEGSVEALDVTARLPLPAGLAYVAGSLRVDGVDPIAGEEARNPLDAGLDLGRLGPAGGPGASERIVTLRATVAVGTPVGTRLTLQGTLSAGNIDDEILTNSAVVTVTGEAALGDVTLSVTDGGADRRFAPGADVVYTLAIANNAGQAVGGVTVSDRLPPELTLVEVRHASGALRVDAARNEWTVDGLVVPPEGATVTIRTRLASFAELAERHGAAAVGGLAIDNRATVVLGQGRRASDDPSTVPPDATRFIVALAVDLSGNGTSKVGVDLNGGALSAGDRVRYTISISNRGDEPSEVLVTDALPASTGECRVEAAPAGVVCAGDRVQGLVDVAVGATVEIVFDVTVDAAAPLGTVVENVATLRPQGAPEQEVAVRSARLRVGPSMAAALSLAKTVEPARAAPGDLVSYALAVTNVGGAEAEDVVIEDVLPPGIFAQVVPLAGVLDADTARWDALTEPALARVAPGEIVVVRMTARLAQRVPAGTVSNQASARGGNAAEVRSDDPTTAVDGDATDLVVVARPTFGGFSKTVDVPLGQRVAPGQVLLYTLSVVNRGEVALEDVVITDRLDDGLELVDAPGAEPGAGPVTFAVGTLRSQQSRSFEIRARVRRDLAGGVTISNQAQAVATGAAEAASDDPRTPVAGDGTDVVVAGQIDLSAATKAAIDLDGPTLEARDAVLYRIRVRNNGTEAAQDVTIRDLPPPELSDFVPATGGEPEVQADGALLWRVGALAPGAEVEVSFTATVSAEVREGQAISNQAQVGARGLGAPELTDDPATPEIDDPSVLIVGAGRPDLGGHKSVRDENGGLFAAGDRVTYTLLVTNGSPEEIAGIQVVDPLDRNLTDIEAEGAVLQNGEARWSDLRIASQTTLRLTLSGRIREGVVPGTVIGNQYGIRVGNDGRFILSDDPLTDDLFDPVRFTVAGAGPGRLRVEKTALGGPEGFLAGDDVDYSVTLFNDGGAPLDDVEVTDVVDTARLDAVRTAQGGSFDGGRIVWSGAGTPTLRSIAPGARVELGFTARIRPEVAVGESIANQAAARAAGAPAAVLSDDPGTAEANDPTRFAVTGALGLDVTKVVVTPAPELLLPGAVVTYDIVATNRGQTDLVRLVLRDRLPDQVEYVAGSTLLNGAPAADDGARAPFDGGMLIAGPGARPGNPLRPGEAATVRFRARVRGDVLAGQAIANQATVTDGTGAVEPSDDPATPADDDPTVVRVAGQADLTRFLKTFRIIDGDGDDRVPVGGTIEWRLAVTNTGAGSAQRVQITDPLPARTTYVAGSIRVDGAARTDAADGDGAQVADGQLRVDLASIARDQTVVVTFRSRVEAGPRIQNQARLRAPGVVEEPSDVDGNEANGDGPTLVLVGEAPRRGLSLQKRVEDPTGAPVQAGEVLRYRLTLRNEGTVPLTDVELSDPLPAGVTLQGVEDPPAGAQVESLPNRVTLRGLSLGAEASAEIVLRVVVSPDAAPGREICNVANAEAPDVGRVDSAPACFTPVLQRGALAGTTFQDLDDDGLPGADDRVFRGMRVALSEAADPDAPPVAEAVSDDAGRFRLEDLRVGAYRARVFSATDVLLAIRDDVQVVAGDAGRLDLLIDPSGRVYDSVEGTLIDGAEVFIYRDEDPSDRDVFDAESRAQRVLVPVEDLEAPSQQGQRTAHGGLYRFNVRRPGRYIVEVLPPGPSFVSPSVLVPPVGGLAFTDDPEGRVVESDLPSVEPSADRTYFLGFDLQGPDDQFLNNHIPVDPLSALIDLQKRAQRPEATVGDVVTYEIDVTNRSPMDLVFDPRTRTGGVFVQDVIPDGFKYVGGSAVLVRLDGNGEVPLQADDPTGIRILKFGRIVQEGGRNLLRALDLRAGESFRLRYQLVVGANAKPRRVYTNRAVLLADGSVPISRVARAEVRVLADPIFDQGVLVGKVFCDADGDGEQGEGEAGLPGAHVYMDQGVFAVSDAAGKFHFDDIDPGTHAIKVDTNTLLPGAALTTDETRVISFTRGLPAKVAFGVTCPAEVRDDPVLELSADGLQSALELLRRRYVVVTGNVRALRARVGDTPVAATAPGVTLVVDGAPAADGLDLRPGAEGTVSRLAFDAQVPAGLESDRWALWVGPLDEEEVVVAEGRGAPPARIGWDQRGPDGAPFLAPGRIYAYRLELATRDGRVSGSPAGTFGVGASGSPSALLVTLRGEFFDARGQGNDKLRRALRPHLKALQKAEGALVFEAHGDDQPPEDERVARTQAQADAAAVVLRSLLGAREVEAAGLGSSRPVVPNLSDRNRARNRRLEIRLRPTGAGPTVEGLSVRAGYAAGAVAGRDSTAAEGDGEFAFVARVPDDGVLEVALRDADGRRAVFPVRVFESSPAARGAPRDVVISARLPDELTVGGAPAPWTPPTLRVEAPAAVALREGRVVAPVEFGLTPGEGVESWRFALAGPDGAVVFSDGGAGVPPARLTWTPDATAPLVPGTFRYRLTVRTAGLTLAQSPEGLLVLGDGPAAAAPPPGAWGLAVNGRALAPGADGRLQTSVPVRSGEAVLLEVTTPEGARAIFFAVPPGPAAATTAAAPAPIVPPPTEGAESPAADTPTGRAPAPLTPPPTERTSLPAEARKEMADFGRDELLRVLAPRPGAATQPLDAPPAGATDADVPARQLRVELPPAGAELASRTLPVRGTTAPGNRVYLNGAEVGVDEEGRFGAAAVLPEGESDLEIVAVDPAGNRGVLRHRLRVKDQAWFLLALGEGLTGSAGTELDGVEPHTSTRIGDTLYVHGRAAVYLKGTMSGREVLDGLFQRYDLTAHLDTARRREFESYFRQIIDPEAFYPAYGDSATLTQDVNTRGPLYVLLRADRSTLTVGNFKTAIRGVELLDYDRALYGAQLALDHVTGPVRHEVKAFVSDGESPERHAYVELRGTGGSLYYLPHEYLVEGSEQIYLVERDKISGIERRRVPLARDADYTVRYREGRLLMKTPVPSVTLDSFGPLPQPGGEVLDGHPVYLSVEYDHADPFQFGDIAAGAHVRETIAEKFTIGGGYIEEGRADDSTPRYKLWGGELGVRHGRRTHLALEVARSQSQNAENLFSEDGGLTFAPFNGRDGIGERGTSFLVRGGLELDDFLGEATEDHWYTEAYWQYIAPGFYSGGTIQQQGLEKYGGLTQYRLSEEHTLRLQHDGIVADDPETQGASVFRAYRRDVTRVGHGYQSGRLRVDTELVHTDEEPGEDLPDLVTDVIASGLEYRIDPRWTALFEQEVVVQGDERIHDEFTDLLITTVGGRFQPTSEVSIELKESVRWSGDNATQLGLRTEVDDRHTLYVQERIASQDGTTSTSSVIGGEERWGEDKSGRSYGEYQLETGELGARNRAVLGVGKRTQVVQGLTLDAAYERSQVLGDTGAGEFSQDAVSLGVEWLDRERVKVSGRYELRYDDNDEEVARRDRMQFLTLNGLSWGLTRDLTLLLRANYSHTVDLGLDATEAELAELSLGLALRPADYDWVALLVKYTKRYEQRPIDVALEEPVREESDVVALVPILELPFHFQLVEKLALKRTALRTAQLPTVVSDSLLWINRLNYHLTNTWDIGGEYRLLEVSLAQNVLHGALFEVNYIVQRRVRLGLGYNFTRFSDDEFARLDEDHGGPFFRVIGNY